jgi:hypothetical protein
LLKTFTIKEDGKNSDRLVEDVKHQIRKYIKREKRKKLPEKARCWYFDCRFAREGEEFKVIEFKNITENVDISAKSEDCSFQIEILSKPYMGNTKEESE